MAVEDDDFSISQTSLAFQFVCRFRERKVRKEPNSTVGWDF